MIGKHNLEFVNYSARLKDWRYLDNFCFLPTIYTGVIQAYGSKRYKYTRLLYFHWLGIMAGVEWEFCERDGRGR